MIFEFILLFLALCFITMPSASIGFLLAAGVVHVVRGYWSKKEAELLRKEIADLTAEIGREIVPLKRQIQFLSEQLATLHPGRHEDTKPASSAITEKVESRPVIHVEPAATATAASKTAEPLKPAVPVTPVPAPPPWPTPPARTESVRVSPSEIAAHSPAPPPVPPAVTPEVPAPVSLAQTTEAAGPRTSAPVPVTPVIPVQAASSQKPIAPPPPPPPVGAVPIAARSSVSNEAETKAAQTYAAQTHAAMRTPPATAGFTHSVTSATQKEAAKPAKKAWNFEEVFATNVLPKVSVILLVVVMVWFGRYEFKAMGALGKVALLYVTSALLLGVGIFAEKRERYKILGRTGIGGGWALLFFTTFAMQYVAELRMFDHRVVDSVLLLVTAFAMTIHTLRYRSQLVTGFAFLLAYATIAISNSPFYSLTAGVILALGIVYLVRRMSWFELEVFGVLSSYLTHLYWLYILLGPLGAQGHPFAEFVPSAAILFSYWAIYRGSYLLRTIHTNNEERVSSLAAILNTFLLLFVMKFQAVHHDLAFFALLALGILEFSLAQLPVTRKRREAFILLSTLGAALMVAAMPFRYSGGNVVVLWLVAAEVFLIAGVAFREVVFRRLGMLIGLAVAVHCAVVDLPDLFSNHGWPVHDPAGPMYAEALLFLFAGAAFYANYLLAGSRWKDLFGERADRVLTALHSYSGCVLAFFGVWAISTTSWTMVGWAAVMLALAFAGRRFASGHVSLQATILGCAGLLWAAIMNLPATAGTDRYFSIPAFCVAAACFYASSWQIWFSRKDLESLARIVSGWAGTGLLWALIAAKVPTEWQPLALLLLAVVLAEAGARLQHRPLVFHVHALAAWATISGLWNSYEGTIPSHGINPKFFVPIAIAVLLYWLAKRTGDIARTAAAFVRDAYLWAGTAVVAVLIAREAQPAWMALEWLGYGVALTLIGRNRKLASLCQQEWALAAISIFRTFYTFYDGWMWTNHERLQLLVVGLTAAILYGISRFSFLEDSDDNSWIAYTHTWAATALLATLAWKQSPEFWLAAVLAGFALLLALIDRKLKTPELKYQAHALAAVSLAFVVGRDIPAMQRVRGSDPSSSLANILTPFLASVSVVLVLYFLSPLLRWTEEQRRRNVPHVYTWPASALAAALIWYGVTPTGVAIGWAVFGVILFWTGLYYKILHLRLQGYVALICSFARIFFVDLNSSPLTVVVIAGILYFVHASLKGETELETESRLRMSGLLSYLGTAAVAALCYFQFNPERAPVAWAVMVVLLLAAALYLRNSVYLHQGMLLVVGIFFYGLIHNLADVWRQVPSTSREHILPLEIAIGILVLALFFAYRLRNLEPALPTAGLLARVAGAFVRRPEQVLFFAAALLTAATIFQWNPGLVTLGWGVEGLAAFLAALLLKEKSFLRTGLALLALCLLRIAVHDFWRLNTLGKIGTVFVLALSGLIVSLLFSRNLEKIREFL